MIAAAAGRAHDAPAGAGAGDARPLPPDLAGFRGFHAGASAVVCGCGASLRQFEGPERFVTIGVNDVGRLLTPDYLVVVNTRHQFPRERFDAVAQSRARALFTPYDLGVPHPHVVRFRLGRRGGTADGDPNTLDYTRNSTYVAACLAIHMGARRIGLIGVDFTPGHFFGGEQAHALARELPQIDAEYGRLRDACARRGIELVNLSPQSRLTTLPKTSVALFDASSRPLRIVSYATTPVAGVPAVLGRAVARETRHEGRTVWARDGYGNGVVFEGDVEYQRQPAQAADLLDAADVVVVHNGKVERQHAAVIDRKPVVTLAHNYMWNVDARFVGRGLPGLVVGQYQATLPEFADWTPVPNPIPLWEASHAADDPARGGAGEPVTVCYAPSGRHERYPVGHRLFWHAKGYATTMRVLDELRRTRGIRLEVVRDRQVSHRECMAMKRRSHIVIDECATGSYHRASLEGLAVGAVVVNGLGLLPGVPELLKHCADGAETIPFTPASLDSLHDVLLGLIARGPESLREEGRRNRAWMERHWSFGGQWGRFWMPAIERAMGRADAARSEAPAAPRPPGPPPAALPPAASAHVVPIASAVRAPPPAALPPHPGPPAPAAAPAVTAVVPFGGAERLPALAAVLAALRDQGLGEAVVAEVGPAPCAREAAARAGARHVFIADAAFHKARALNVGTGFAATDLVLWCDADILLPPGFVASSLVELDQRRLDYLVPWSAIRYLGEADSLAVIAGARDPRAAPAVKTASTRDGGRGGVALLRAAFAARYGGVCEAFRGWGGEDEAVFAKASLLARAAVTSRGDRAAHHLFHPRAGFLDPAGARAGNPRHAENRALLREIRQIGSRDLFLRRFPAPTHPPAPWAGTKRIAPAPGAEALARALAERYGPAIRCCGPGEGAATVLRAPAVPAPGAGVPLDGILAAAAELALPESPTMQPATPKPAAPAAPLRVNLGCGDASVPGFLNVDRFVTPNVDRQVDLAGPWPWADGAVDAIRAWDVIEHLPDKIQTMNEMWRVLRPGGRAEIVVPTTDGTGAFQDPTHVSFWNRRSFLYYEAGNPYRERFAASYGIDAAFRVVSEAVARTADGPKLTIVLEAVKPRPAPAVPDPPPAEAVPYDVVILSAVAANLIACVEALRACEPDLDPSRIIVVDDGARPGAEPALPGLRWIAGEKPFVFARNVNIALAASGRDVVLLNDDALLATPGGFGRLAEAARRGRAPPGAVAAAVRGVVGNPNQRPRAGGGLRPEPRHLCFVCVYLPRATLDAVGDLDARFTGYGFDDDDYCDRIRAAGLALAVHDGCVVDHSGRVASTFRTRADFPALLDGNRKLYQDKRAGAAPAGAAPAEPDVLCAMRVKNEAAHIGEVLDSVLPLCGRVLVFDDHSDDATPAICSAFGPRVEVVGSPFAGLDEARDKNDLLARIAARDPDWVLWIDGDEVLERAGPDRLRALLAGPGPAAVYTLQIAYAWDDPGRIRVDGLFGRFRRPSLFRLRGQPRDGLSFARTGPAGLHCGNVPRGIRGPVAAAPVRLKHYGYLDAEQRRRKYEWYNRVDPGNRAEDEYRHLIGLPGARHAPGPPVIVGWDE